MTSEADADRHVRSYFGAMPIRSVLEFAASAGGPDPEARIAQLLDAVRGEDAAHDIPTELAALGR